MKIGIYTFFRSNYGAILQAYSLQRAIKELCPDDEVLMVDFKTNYHQSLEKVFSKRSDNKLYNFIWQCYILIRYNQLKRKINAFKEFQQSQFDYTPRYSTMKSLLTNPPKLDVHLSGSDQVFNPMNQYRDVYYLKFNKGKARKVAYAPSFGIHEFTEEQEEWIKKTLSDFDCLTCRESQGAKFMSNLMDRDIPIVLDPVFLTSKQQWNLLSVKYKTRRPYIFIYCLNSVAVSYLLDVAKKIKKQCKGNLQIILLSPNDLRIRLGCKQLFDVGPREFLGLINGAEYVVTDSFHGTAFSIIFQKRFCTYISRPTVSSRIESLLIILNLIDRIIDDKCTGVNLQSLSFDYVETLNQRIAESKLELQKMLK